MIYLSLIIKGKLKTNNLKNRELSTNHLAEEQTSSGVIAKMKNNMEIKKERRMCC